MPMAEDFHASADLLFAHCSALFETCWSRSGYAATTAEVSRLRCERDRSVAQGVIRRIKIREFTVGCFES